jgi:hypothetical protein
VQPLINKETEVHMVLFIDFTEANHLSIPLTPADESAWVLWWNVCLDTRLFERFGGGGVEDGDE